MMTHEEFIKKHNLSIRRYYQKNGWLYVNFYSLRDDEYYYNEIKFYDLPSKIEFTEECDFDIILDIEKIPPDIIFNHRGDVEILYAEEISENVVFNNLGDVHLGYDFDRYILPPLGRKLMKIYQIHPSVKFKNVGNVYLGDIINKIPKEISFDNKFNVFCFFIKEISENVIFNNKGNLFFKDIEKIHPSVKFINGGNIDFSYKSSSVKKNLKELTFSNNGNVKISKNIEHISNINFNNNGNVEFEGKPVISQEVYFNNKGIVINKPINIPKFLDPEKYLNKMLKQIYK